jgi:nitrile hydratase beta subunit
VNSAHDVGGMHGFGRVLYEENEPVFHEDWERRAFTVFVTGIDATIDEMRHAMERMGNSRYLSASYYEHWLIAAEMILIEKGVVSEREYGARLEALRKDPASVEPPANEGPDELSRHLAESIRTGNSTLRESRAQPRFRVGDVVRTRVINPTGHTRLPRYARGRRATIVAYHGAHVLPDTNAHGLGECPEPLYTARFDAQELWGEDGVGSDFVHLDLWESYLASNP